MALLSGSVTLLHRLLSMEHPEALAGSQELPVSNPGCSELGV